MIGALFDAAPDAARPQATPWHPAPAPVAAQQAADCWRERLAALAGVGAGLGHPIASARRLGPLARQVRMLAHEGLAPKLSLNRPVGSGRLLKLATAELARAREVARAHGATVNDVVLAAAAGGAGRLLAARDELTPGLIVKVSVAACIRGPADPTRSGNRVGVMLAPLAVAEPDPQRRLVRIAQATSERKRYPPYMPASRFGQRWMVRAMSHQRLVNLFTSNLVGPQAPLYLAGARVLRVFQVGAVQGNVTLAVGVLSYAG